MSIVIASFAALLLVLGAFITLVAALGLLRLPDLFCRTHAASKAGTAGSGLVLIAVCLQANDVETVIKCCAAIVFFVLTAPISAHLLAKAALKAGYAVRFLDTPSKT